MIIPDTEEAIALAKDTGCGINDLEMWYSSFMDIRDEQYIDGEFKFNMHVYHTMEDPV